MHQLITRRMKRYMMFGFTGTPIFAVNANKGSKYSTTAQLFGGEPDDEGKPTKALHVYTIINAIGDKNVLRFHVDYDSTMKMKNDVEHKQVWGIDTEEALHNPQRISIITRYIIDRFGEKTKQEAEAYAMSKLLNVQEAFSQFFGGTSLLILVGVVIDTLQQVESYLLMRHYDGLLNSGHTRQGSVSAY